MRQLYFLGIKMRSTWLFICMFLSGALQAAPVTWTLNDVVLADLDATTLTGSFVYDADTGVMSNVNIFSTSFPQFPEGFEYNDSNIFSTEYCYSDPWNCGPYASTRFEAATELPDFVRDLYIVYDAPLTNAGGVINIIAVNDVYVDVPNEFPLNERTLSLPTTATISATAVPLPAAVWLFGSALAGLGWMRRKQTV
jgi:hypothetical protein